MIIPLGVAGLVHVNETVVFVGCDVKFRGISPGTIHIIIIEYNNEKQAIQCTKTY